MEAAIAIERAARESYTRLIAFLAARSGDLAAAEDALSDAFLAALEHWPRTGVPQKPEAWLLTAARRKLIDASRHAKVHENSAPELLTIATEAGDLTEHDMFPDERLKLMFICAHPAIDAATRTPLMLQVVLGLDAARIASLFLVKPSAMGQRLSRAKTKIRDAGIRFAIPEAEHLPERLDAVLEAIYAAYTSDCDEAIDLGRLLLQLLPRAPEAEGLLALMLYCESRKGARRSAAGAYIPLSEQDVSQWSAPMMEEAAGHLTTASQAGVIGRFQLEAAIQSIHAQRAATGETQWEAIALLYEGLVRLAPTIGALVGRAAAVAEARDAATGWKLLSEIPSDDVQTYQPYWALAAHLLRCLGRREESLSAYGRAMGLCEDPAMREFLARRAEAHPT